MAKANRHKEQLRRLTLSCDSFTTGYTVMLMLFFVPYCARFGGAVVLACMPLVCLVPFAVMPLVYTAVHRFNPLLFGRYHLVMPVSAALAALFFAAAFSSAEANASGACMIFFGALIFAVTLITYRYCAFSVRARLIGDGVERRSVFSACLSVAGAAAAAATALCFNAVDPDGFYADSAFALAAMNLILATVQYLVSFYDIPRLGGKRSRSVKNAFRMLYAGLNKRRYFAALCAPAGFAAAAMLCALYAMTALTSFVAPVAALVSAFAVTSAAFRAFRSPRILFDIGRCCVAVAAAALGASVALDGVAAFSCVTAAAVVLGAGGALAWRGSTVELLYVKRRVTSGTVCLLTELTAYAAAAVALAAAAAVYLLLKYVGGADMFAYGFAAAGALAVVSVVLANIRNKRSGGNDEARPLCDTTIDDGLNRLLDKREITEEENL